MVQRWAALGSQHVCLRGAGYEATAWRTVAATLAPSRATKNSAAAEPEEEERSSSRIGRMSHKSGMVMFVVVRYMASSPRRQRIRETEAASHQKW